MTQVLFWGCVAAFVAALLNAQIQRTTRSAVAFIAVGAFAILTLVTLAVMRH